MTVTINNSSRRDKNSTTNLSKASELTKSDSQCFFEFHIMLLGCKYPDLYAVLLNGAQKREPVHLFSWLGTSHVVISTSISA